MTFNRRRFSLTIGGFDCSFGIGPLDGSSLPSRSRRRLNCFSDQLVSFVVRPSHQTGLHSRRWLALAATHTQYSSSRANRS